MQCLFNVVRTIEWYKDVLHLVILVAGTQVNVVLKCVYGPHSSFSQLTEVSRNGSIGNKGFNNSKKGYF